MVFNVDTLVAMHLYRSKRNASLRASQEYYNVLVIRSVSNSKGKQREHLITRCRVVRSSGLKTAVLIWFWLLFFIFLLIFFFFYVRLSAETDLLARYVFFSAFCDRKQKKPPTTVVVYVTILLSDLNVSLCAAQLWSTQWTRDNNIYMIQCGEKKNSARALTFARRLFVMYIKTPVTR